jgi:arylsulfatase A-like enzyme
MPSPLSRRAFLKAGVGTALTSAASRLPAALSTKRPNVLILTTDQQSAEAMSCQIGTRFLHTPNLDSLAASGMRFPRAYAANPICVPSRTSMYTGRYPVETGVETNDDLKPGLDPSKFPCMGTIFERSRYQTAYFGKWHLPYPVENKLAHGFQHVEDQIIDRKTADEAVRFLSNKPSQPFLAVASFLNPHNICNWARGEKLSQGDIGAPPAPAECPPLRANFAPQQDEPDIMALMRKSYQRNPMFPVGDFDEGKWRQYQWAYYRMIEKADALIGHVLQAVRTHRLEDNTLVVFLADHGDCKGAHHWNQKTVFYEESARVPFMLKLPGTVKPGTSDRLVNTGVDLIPTLCGAAGIPHPKDLPGLDLMGTTTGRIRQDPREYVVSSNHMVQGAPIDGKIPKPQGRMVRSQRYKYCVYNEGNRRESLVDLVNDPGETVNLAGQPRFGNILKSHRQMLAQWGGSVGDTFPQRRKP